MSFYLLRLQGRVRLPLYAVLAALTVFVLAVLFAGGSKAAAGGTGVFIAKCNVNQFRSVDPIVAPGVEPSAHEHVFWGASGVTKDSTVASLQASVGSCPGLPSDTAGYWWPSFYGPNGRIPPLTGRVFTYYRAHQQVQTMPLGLKMVAGGSAGPSHVEFKCFSGTSQVVQTIPYCAGGSQNHLEAIIHFPSCWNGHDLDSADHRSHMAYPSGSSCPSGYPVRLPEVTQNVQLCANCGGPGYHFSDGSTAGAFPPHADFWFTWHQARFDQLVAQCLNAGVNCGAVSG